MIGFIGLSHLGLVYSMATAAKGMDVVAYDPDASLAARCRAGDFPIEEPGFRDLFERHRTRIEYTADRGRLSACEVVFYALDVRTDADNTSDLGPLSRLVQETVGSLSASATVVLLSQVPPGFTRDLVAGLAARGEAKQRSFFYQVETLVFGDAVARAMQPERYIVGAPEAGRPPAPALQRWHAAFGCPVLVMRYESAELAKLAINFFLVSSVTTTNVLAEVCEAIGANWHEIVPALRLDRRIGQHAYLSPGLGLAGGNLERDLVTVLGLSARHGIEQDVVRSWQRNSRHRRTWAGRVLEQEVLGGIADPQIAVWGLTYKADTHSVKNSPSLDLLAGLTRFRVRVHDPIAVVDLAGYQRLSRCADPMEAADGADALVVMTPWNEYRKASVHRLKERMRGRLVIDPYGALDGEACRAAGLLHRRLGC